jgi:hypothetical protein
METLTHIQKRERAIKWWYNLTPTEFREMMAKHFPGREVGNVTGREVQHVYESEIEK